MFRTVVLLSFILPSTLFAQTPTTPQPEAAAPRKGFMKLMNGTAVAVTACYDSQGKEVPGVAGQPFTNPPAVTGDNPNVPLDVRQFKRTVPVYTYFFGDPTCTMKEFNLRLYGYQPTPGGPFTYAFPGPTIVLNKPRGSKPGDSLTIPLTNNLPLSNDDCIQTGNPLCVCPGTTTDPQCCSAVQVKKPNCFHGDNTTNLHFHGTHVSPQAPQDYVLLELEPAGTLHEHESHSSLGETAIGSYTYKVNPLQSTQPPGTQWYHPHKHGSTALQVANGMTGALLIMGEFDQMLQDFYKDVGGLTDQLMVMQQIHDLNFVQPGSSAVLAPMPLINGKLQPVVTMKPNEIQRWRFVAATMEASAQISIDFDGPAGGGVEARQIAMDGVRFSDRNYECQPLLDATPCDGQPQGLEFNLSPGNRADFLVKAPAAAGMYALTYNLFGRVDRQGDRRPELTRLGRGKRQPTVEDVKDILEAIAPGDAETALLLVKVECPEGTQCPNMDFPPSLGPMPPYLQNIPAQTDGSQVLQFRLTKAADGSGIGAETTQPQFFGIAVQSQSNGAFQQFNGNCANFTEPLNRTETWTLSQNMNDVVFSKPFHVFHIHTNHFQTVRFGTTTYPEPIWMDSITLPNTTNVANTFPTDDASTVLIRQQFLDYTGAYVFHCHFLGHEDRGMMMLVQTVCPNAPGYYGIPDPKGGPDNCQICVTNPEQCKKAAPTYPCTTAAARKRLPKR